MFIQTEETPNPQAMKFLMGRSVLPGQVIEFAREDDDLQRSPLARRLMTVDGVERVLLGEDFITITKSATMDWYVLKPLVLGVLLEFFLSNQQVVLSEGEKISSEEDDSPLISHIKDLLDTRIRPAVAMDGGDIAFDRFEDGIVYVRMKGACSGCPSSTATLKSGIENMLKHYIPEVQEVRAV